MHVLNESGDEIGYPGNTVSPIMHTRSSMQGPAFLDSGSTPKQLAYASRRMYWEAMVQRMQRMQLPLS
jgi:hypothetical protein